MEEKKTILSQLTPIHDQMFSKLRAAKSAQGKTLQQIEAETGVPVHNVDRVMRGEQTRPNAFYLAALCVDLNLSMDKLLGVPTHESVDNAEQLEHLKEENEALKYENYGLQKDLEHERYIVEAKEKEIRFRRPLIYCLVAISFVMATALMLYLAFDHSVAGAGLIIGGQASILAVLLGGIIVASVLTAVALLVNLLRSKHRGEGKK